jgi:hypothetical protein
MGILQPRAAREGMANVTHGSIELMVSEKLER